MAWNVLGNITGRITSALGVLGLRLYMITLVTRQMLLDIWRWVLEKKDAVLQRRKDKR